MLSDIQAIRRNALRTLCGTERGGRREMAERLGIDESYLSQMIGKHPTKPIGDRMARRIEKHLGLPPHSLDHEHRPVSEDAMGVARDFDKLTVDQRQAFKGLLRSMKK